MTSQWRPSGAAYRGEWVKLRDAYLAANPTCGWPRCHNPATEAHHIVSVRRAPKRRLDPANLVGYCLSHHRSLHRRAQPRADGWRPA